MIIMTQGHEVKKQKKKIVNVFDLEYIIYRKLAVIIKDSMINNAWKLEVKFLHIQSKAFIKDF